MKLRLILCFLMFAISSCAALPEYYINLDSGSNITFNEILSEIQDKRIIFVGEIHTNPSSHRVQLEVIKYLFKSGKEVSIAVEIFSPDKQDYLDKWVSGDISRQNFIEIFRSEVNLPFSAYEDIFNYAAQMKIPIVGIDAERTLIAKVSKQGIKTVPVDFLETVKFTECAEEPEYAKMLGFAGDREYHQSGMPFLCDAQRLRDAVMAYNISRILHADNSTIVVMSGLVHASKVAVPDILQKHIASDYIVLMPDLIKYITNRNPDAGIADYIWY